MDTEGPRKRVGRAERERQILDAAIAVFGERGFQAASMDAVAERVGVTKPVLYTHFGSKDGLLEACVARARAELLEVTTAAVAAAGTAEERMRAGTIAYFDFLAENERTWTLLYSESPSAGEALKAVRDQQGELVAGYIRHYLPDVEPRRASAWAHVVVGACEQLAHWWDDHQDTTSAELAGYLMDMVWDGLGARPRVEA